MASAIIASMTTSDMAAPIFCIINKMVRYICDILIDSTDPIMIHGTRERVVDMTKYGTRFLPLIGTQSDSILQKMSLYSTIK